MSRVVIASAIVGLLGGVLLLTGGGGGGDVVPDRPDILGQCYVADRAAKVEILNEMATKEFRSDEAQGDWLNSQVQEATSVAMEPFVDQVAKAIIEDTVADLAEAIR